MNCKQFNDISLLNGWEKMETNDARHRGCDLVDNNSR